MAVYGGIHRNDALRKYQVSVRGRYNSCMRVRGTARELSFFFFFFSSFFHGMERRFSRGATLTSTSLTECISACRLAPSTGGWTAGWTVRRAGPKWSLPPGSVTAARRRRAGLGCQTRTLRERACQLSLRHGGTQAAAGPDRGAGGTVILASES